MPVVLPPSTTPAPAPTLPGLGMDAVTLYRPNAGLQDAEGNPTNALATIASTRGTWSELTNTEEVRMAQRGQRVDAVLSVQATVDVQPGDFLDVRSKRWAVVDVMLTRFHQRAFLRRAE